MRRATNPVASAAQQLDEMCTLAAKDLDQQALVRIRELIDVTSERSEVDPSWCVIGMLGGTALCCREAENRRICWDGWVSVVGWRRRKRCLATPSSLICRTLIRSRPATRRSPIA